MQFEQRYRERSLWLDGVPSSLSPRPPLPGDGTCDVAIVGAGFAGLWIAYHLKTLAPELDVALIEREIAGFGAAGRNGGTCSGGISGDPEIYAREHGEEAVRKAERLSYEAVDDMADIIEKEGIDCGWHKGGRLGIAVTVPARDRIDQALERRRRWGHDFGHWQKLERDELEQRVRIPGALAALYSPQSARVDPARLARGLAEAVERKGVTIYEATAAQRIEPGLVVTEHGSVRAKHVIRTTEAWTVELPGEHRRFLPTYTLMCATEPLSAEVWDKIGLEGRETFGFMGHLACYGQRTIDDRIALGGRGLPYAFGSRLDERYERDPEILKALTSDIARLFPAAAEAKITHHWGGAIAVARDWCQSVVYDPSSGFGWSGGFAGTGVMNAHLAGRAMTDLVLGKTSEFTEMPFVGHRTRLWEYEPLRYVARRSIVTVLKSADKAEQETNRPARRVALVQPFVRGHR